MLTCCLLGVRKLRGDVVPYELSWSDNVTHVVINRMSNTIKIMCGIVAGKPLLMTSFVRASLAAGHWVPEEEHLWRDLEKVDAEHRDLITAAAHWRAVVAKQEGPGRKGVFRGWRVFLVMSKENIKTYTTLFKAGGATLEHDFMRFMSAVRNTPRGATNAATGERNLVVTDPEEKNGKELRDISQQALKGGVETKDTTWVVGYISEIHPAELSV